MSRAGVVAIIATMDTKGEEAVFLSDWFRAQGHEVRIVDVGTAADPPHPLAASDVRRGEVARAAGVRVDALASMRRDEAMAAMGRGAGAVLHAWCDGRRLAGVIGVGGNQGTAVSSLAMRALPFGIPRVLVSTVASGNIRPFIEHSEIAVVFSVGDLLGGPNRVTRPVLIRAAGMLAGMIDSSTPSGGSGPRDVAAPAVAITALGNTHAAVTRVMSRLRSRAYEVVPFHASGAGGSAMESLVRAGEFDAVIDLTPHELVGEVLADDIYAPVHAGRLTAAGAVGIPQVVAPGGLDYFVFGTPGTVPDRYRARPTHYHNPYNTNVRATADELTSVGRVLADRLNAARGRVAFLYPLRGWSFIGRIGGPLWDPAANDALREAVRQTLRTSVRYVEVDAWINDPQFADEAAAIVCEWLGQRDVSGHPREQAEGGVPC